MDTSKNIAERLRSTRGLLVYSTGRLRQTPWGWIILTVPRFFMCVFLYLFKGTNGVNLKSRKWVREMDKRTKMKKILLAAIFMSAATIVAYGQSPLAKKIADAYEGANGPCRTESGERGTLYPNKVKETTSSGNSNSNNYNSSNSASGSASFSAGITKLEGSVSGSATVNSSHGTNNTTNTQNSREVEYICVPNR